MSPFAQSSLLPQPPPNAPRFSSPCLSSSTVIPLLPQPSKTWYPQGFVPRARHGQPCPSSIVSLLVTSRSVNRGRCPQALPSSTFLPPSFFPLLTFLGRLPYVRSCVWLWVQRRAGGWSALVSDPNVPSAGRPLRPETWDPPGTSPNLWKPPHFPPVARTPPLLHTKPIRPDFGGLCSSLCLCPGASLPYPPNPGLLQSLPTGVSAPASPFILFSTLRPLKKNFLKCKAHDLFFRTFFCAPAPCQTSCSRRRGGEAGGVPALPVLSVWGERTDIVSGGGFHKREVP